MLNKFKITLAATALLTLVGCSGLNPLDFFGGGATGINGQIGKENRQTVGVTNETTYAPTTTIKPKARLDNLDQSVNEITNQELPTWVWIVFIVTWIIGWVTDTPATIIKNLLGKRK